MSEHHKENWFKKHSDTMAILGMFAFGFWTLNEKMDAKFETLSHQISAVEKDVAVIKTVMVMKNIYPTELVKIEEK